MSEAKSRSASRRSGRMTGSGGRGSGRPEQAFDEVNSRVRAAERRPRSAAVAKSVRTCPKCHGWLGRWDKYWLVEICSVCKGRGQVRSVRPNNRSSVPPAAAGGG